MAEALLREASSGLFRVASAGSNPSGYVHPLAIKAMGEVGIDLGEARSKHLDEFLEQDVNTVITVCGNADQACPIFPGQAHRYHWGFYDPADATGSEDEQLLVFRRVRDEIRQVFEAYAIGRVDATRDCAQLGGV
ncbi:MAG: arsenate reductase [Verrucomicrobiales bacterium]|jgi:arsenate reductase